MNRLARLGVLAAVATTLLMPGTPASALPATPTLGAPAPARADPPPITFGIRPAGATAPDDRGRFVFGSTPGAVLQDFVAVNNIGSEPVTLRVSAGDAFNTPEGGFDLVAGVPSRDAGAWIALERDSVTVPGGGTRIVPFRLAVPADATPGDHVAGIVASLLTNRVEADGSKVTIDNRVGARVYLRVAGDLRPELSVENVVSSYEQNWNPLAAGSATIRYTVRNTGNLRLDGMQKVGITLPWGTTVDAGPLPRLPELLPGNAITVTATVPSLIPAVLPIAVVRIEPTSIPGDLNPALAAVVEQNPFLAVPLALLGLLLLITLFLLLRRRQRRRAAWRPPSRPDPVEVAA